MLCHDGYKLVADRKARKPVMLFNPKKDPCEMENLIGKPEESPFTEAMTHELFAIADNRDYRV